MLGVYVRTKSLRFVTEFYEMKKDKVHKIIQSTNINFEPQVITHEKLILFIILDGFGLETIINLIKRFKNTQIKTILSKNTSKKYIQ